SVVGTIAISALGLLGMFVLGGVPQAKAILSPSYNLHILPGVSVLGIGVMKSNTFSMDVVDTSTGTTTGYFTLPSVSGKDGQLYVVKRIGYPDSDTHVHISAQPGETIDGDTRKVRLGSQGAMMLVADEDNDGWIIVAQKGGTDFVDPE